MSTKKMEDTDTKSAGSDPKFAVGAAISVYQNSGGGDTNWAWFQQQKSAHIDINLRLSAGKLDEWGSPYVNIAPQSLTSGALWEKLGPSVIQDGAKIGKASDFWNRYEQDIQLAKDIGSNSFRFSIEWGRLYPKQYELDEAAVARYHEIFACLQKHNMEPHCTLHWFVHPFWFEEMGAFQKSENIVVFVDYAKKAFELFGKHCKLWTTFNEPTVASNCGYVTGNHPPGKLLHFRAAGKYLLNILRGHAQAYKAIKAMPGGKDVQVGICHNVWWLEPRRGGPFFWHVRAAVGFANRTWGNECVMNYLKTGVYEHPEPFFRRTRWVDPEGKPGADFFGINHYARGVVGFWLNPTTKGSDKLADMGYPVYPPSLYRAISYASTLGIPMYVYENGMPSKEDDNRREEWINGCMSEVEKAVRDGFDLRGFMYWTLIDNFEWNFAFELKFGLYEWNDDGSQKRRLRDGAQCIKKWYKRLPEELGQVLAKNRNANIKSDEERQKLELDSEKRWLNYKGYDKEEVKEKISEDKNPILTGVY